MALHFYLHNKMYSSFILADAALAQPVTQLHETDRHLESHHGGALTLQPAEHSVVKSSVISIFFTFRSGRILIQIYIWVMCLFWVNVGLVFLNKSQKMIHEV